MHDLEEKKLEQFLRQFRFRAPESFAMLEGASETFRTSGESSSANSVKIQRTLYWSLDPAECSLLDVKSKVSFNHLGRGITYGANESNSGNIEVHVSDATGQASTLPGEEQAVTMGHELYVHGDRLLDGRPAEHEDSPNGEVNKETHEVEERTRRNAREKDPQ